MTISYGSATAVWMKHKKNMIPVTEEKKMLGEKKEKDHVREKRGPLITFLLEELTKSPFFFPFLRMGGKVFNN